MLYGRCSDQPVVVLMVLDTATLVSHELDVSVHVTCASRVLGSLIDSPWSEPQCLWLC